MTTQHTPEPWKSSEKSYLSSDFRYSIYQPDGKQVHDGIRACFRKEADRNRAIACVNACEGINPEAVPIMVNILETMKKKADEHKLQIAPELELAIELALTKAK